MVLHRLLLLMVMVSLCLPAPVAHAQEWVLHKVARGEHLTSISHKYGVTLAQLRHWNHLDTDTLQVGQTLRVGHKGPGEAVHVVRPGESLSKIAGLHGTTVARIKEINGLRRDKIFVGQKLRLREAERNVHIVEKGDALWEIARAYNLSVAELKSINGLSSNRIYVGMELKLNHSTASRKAVYVVQRGDNLTEIARLHQMSLNELRRTNQLRGSVIHPGQELLVRPLLGAKAPPVADDQVDGRQDVSWDALRIKVPGVQKLASGNGPYYYETPKADRQQHKTYLEESSISPLVSYRHAIKLWELFEEEVARLPKRSSRLAGWQFVLDPGHGGIDPGAIVETVDPTGQTHFIVEDEYAYDTALRVYVLLKLHGAEVNMTLLSPNHLLRGNAPVARTFVHDRNEVFNSYQWNKKNRPSTWPKGGQKYLDERVRIAKESFKGVPADRRVFLSFHADHDKPSGDVVTLFYFQNRSRTDTVSRGLARRLLPGMGAGATAKGRSLAVLRNNPARYKLLVEMRNLAYEEHVWAVRYEHLRQRDAEKVVKALVDGLTP